MRVAISSVQAGQERQYALAAGEGVRDCRRQSVEVTFPYNEPALRGYPRIVLSSNALVEADGMHIVC